MSAFYEEMAGIATELLGEFSQGTITLSKSGTSTPAPNPWEPPVTGDATPYTLKATARPVEEKFVDGTTIFSTDIEVTAAPFGSDPDPSDAITIDGKAYSIVTVMRIPAAGTVVAWKIVVRG